MEMLRREYISDSADLTKKLGQKIGELLWEGSCVLLSGDLGAGKTCFTQGLAVGLGITRKVSSPTFTMLKVYNEGRLKLYHLDAYRLEGAFQDVGFSEFIGIEGVTAVEWPEFIEQLLPPEYLKISISYLGEEQRLLQIEAVGEQYCQLVRKVIC